jgi:hypothetical protein
MNKLEEVIKRYVPLNPASSSGWHTMLCNVCHDAGRRGPRAGFKFENNTVSYNCFNCGITGSYSNQKTLSHDMQKILTAYKIPEFEINEVLFNASGAASTNQANRTNLIPGELNLPDYFYELTDDKDDVWCQYSLDYLKDRCIDPTSQKFYCVKLTDNPNSKKWYGRLIIPIYYHDTLIYYIGRDLVGKSKVKYRSVRVKRDNIIYGFNNFKITNGPLYVVEGWFDAANINGVALFGNKLTKEQELILSNVNREKVIIPDRYGNGHILAEQAIKLGWKISLPDIGEAKDINEAIIKYGLLYVLKSIQDNIQDSEMAKVALNLYCKKGN